jgi:hypothetical protein
MAESAGNLNFEFCEGDGKLNTFPLRGDVAVPPVSVTEGTETWPVMRHGIDRGFRWSYDAQSNALIVDGDSPAEGVIISYSYEPKPHVPVKGEEWTTITIERD